MVEDKNMEKILSEYLIWSQTGNISNKINIIDLMS